MKVEKDKIVAIEYSLKDEDGNVIDSSANSGSPLEYLHGHGNLIPGLEKILEGKNPGEKFSAILQMMNHQSMLLNPVLLKNL